MKKLILSALLFTPFIANAQVPKHHEIGINVGVSTFYGDLQPNMIPEDNKLMRPSFGVIYKYFPSAHWGLRFGANYINLMGADSLSLNKTYQKRNLNFRNNVAEIYGAFEFNFLPVGPENFKFTPFVFAGIGAFYSNPFTIDSLGKKQYLRELSTEGQGLSMYPDRKVYPVINASFPIGAGFKFFIGKTVMMTAEVAARYTSTDYIDDVSKSYVNLDTLAAYKGVRSEYFSYRGKEYYNWDGNKPNYGFQRGDFKGNDWFWTVGLTATVYFDAFGNPVRYIQNRCPRIFGRSR
ncbi:MAG TPA: DUF6089 family protein [Edaphocola sp.]|nr:DUF6089 family protein [Edaphocola sp.]